MVPDHQRMEKQEHVLQQRRHGQVKNAGLQAYMLYRSGLQQLGKKCRTISSFYLAQLRNINGPEVTEEVEALVAEQLEELPDAPVLDGGVELHHPHHGPEPVSAAIAEQPLGAELSGVSSSTPRLDTRCRWRHPAIAMSWNGFGMVRTVVLLAMKRWERRKKTRQG